MREDVLLLCLAAFGGIVAVAWGNRRISAPDGDAMIDARTQLQVRLDALRARAIMLRRHEGLTPALLSTIDQVIEHHVLVDGVTASAGSAEELRTLDARLEGAFLTLEQVGRAIGVDAPADDPFAGLCSMDPEHGPATATGPDGEGLCASCRRKRVSGEPLEPRRVSRRGRPVPFTAVNDGPAEPDAHD